MMPLKVKRNAQIMVLKKQGLSFSEIGEIFEIKRQTVHKIYKKMKDKELSAVGDK